MSYVNRTAHANDLTDPKAYHEAFTYRIERTVPWTEPGLKITRLRLLSDPGLPTWDVSYCHGLVGDEPVRVQLPFFQLPKAGLKRAIVEAAKADGLFAKATGIFEALATLQ